MSDKTGTRYFKIGKETFWKFGPGGNRTRTGGGPWTKTAFKSVLRFKMVMFDAIETTAEEAEP